jgi:hypothetical protein
MNQELRNNFYNLVQNISGQKMSTRSLNKLERDYKLPADLVSSFITSTKTLDFYPTPTGCLDNQYINEIINESKNILEPSYGVGNIINYIHNVNPEANITGYELSDGLYNISKSVLLPNSKITLHLKNFLTKDFKDNDFQTIICNPPFTRTYHTDKSHKDNRFYYDFLFKSIRLLKESKLNNKEHQYIIFICPEFARKEKDDRDITSLLKDSNISETKMKQLFKDYLGVPYSKDYEKNYEVMDELMFCKIHEIGDCNIFSGTKYKTKIYLIDNLGFSNLITDYKNKQIQKYNKLLIPEDLEEKISEPLYMPRLPVETDFKSFTNSQLKDYLDAHKIYYDYETDKTKAALTKRIKDNWKPYNEYKNYKKAELMKYIKDNKITVKTKALKIDLIEAIIKHLDKTKNKSFHEIEKILSEYEASLLKNNVVDLEFENQKAIIEQFLKEREDEDYVAPPKNKPANLKDSTGLTNKEFVERLLSNAKPSGIPSSLNSAAFKRFMDAKKAQEQNLFEEQHRQIAEEGAQALEEQMRLDELELQIKRAKKNKAAKTIQSAFKKYMKSKTPKIIDEDYVPPPSVKPDLKKLRKKEAAIIKAINKKIKANPKPSGIPSSLNSAAFKRFMESKNK